MRKFRAASLLLATVALLALTGVIAADTNTGDWAMHRGSRPDTVQLSLSSRDGHLFNYSASWPKSEFPTLDFSRSDAQDVRFAVTRDAGRLDFEGTLRDGAGAGSFWFSPSARYVEDMKALGYSGIEGDRQLAMAIHDVSLKFARDMRDRKLHDLDTEKLLAFRIHGVTGQFIDGLQAAGLHESDSNNLIAFRIHGVTADMVRSLRSSGYEIASEQLIAMRIHGVSFEFIDALKKLGYEHPKPELLIAMRVHGVSPEYIEQLQARGVKDLTLEKLLAMKIHGID
jgi:hypothetical protein